MWEMRLIILLSASTIFIVGCDTSDKTSRDKEFWANNILASMVDVKDGRFQMGDFGPLVGEELPFSPDQDNKPLHWVELTDFKIAKNKVTWKEFNAWSMIVGNGYNEYYNKIKKRKIEDSYDQKINITIDDNYPASVNWYDANKFCKWIGEVSGKSITLPTEAQWEYAARSRGQFL